MRNHGEASRKPDLRVPHYGTEFTIRIGMRHIAPLTNAFSKKWENLEVAYNLWFAYYNFCRVHRALLVTPALGGI